MHKPSGALARCISPLLTSPLVTAKWWDIDTQEPRARGGGGIATAGGLVIDLLGRATVLEAKIGAGAGTAKGGLTRPGSTSRPNPTSGAVKRRDAHPGAGDYG